MCGGFVLFVLFVFFLFFFGLVWFGFENIFVSVFLTHKNFKENHKGGREKRDKEKKKNKKNHNAEFGFKARKSI